MPFDKAGNGESPPELDDFGCIAGERIHLFIAAHGHNPPVVDGNRFGHCVVGVHSGDKAAAQNEVGAGCGVRWGVGGAGRGAEEGGRAEGEDRSIDHHLYDYSQYDRCRL